jgi:hypothetical protein
MSLRDQAVEINRLISAFEGEAAKFHDIRLRTIFVTPSRTGSDIKFTSPNHAVMPWQYYGCIGSDQDTQYLLNNIKESDLQWGLVTQSRVQVLRSQQRILYISHTRFIRSRGNNLLVWANGATPMESVCCCKLMTGPSALFRRGAELTSFAVIEGAETPLFVRMAQRAGSLFSETEARTIGSRVVDEIYRASDLNTHPASRQRLRTTIRWLFG